MRLTACSIRVLNKELKNRRHGFENFVRVGVAAVAVYPILKEEAMRPSSKNLNPSCTSRHWSLDRPTWRHAAKPSRDPITGLNKFERKQIEFDKKQLDFEKMQIEINIINNHLSTSRNSTSYLAVIAAAPLAWLLTKAVEEKEGHYWDIVFACILIGVFLFVFCMHFLQVKLANKLRNLEKARWM